MSSTDKIFKITMWLNVGSQTNALNSHSVLAQAKNKTTRHSLITRNKALLNLSYKLATPHVYTNTPEAIEDIP